MDCSPAYRQEHAKLTVEELSVTQGLHGGDVFCSLSGSQPVTTLDFSEVKRLNYTWTSDTRVTVHCEWSELVEQVCRTNPTTPGEKLTQTPFDYLQHDVGMGIGMHAS